MTLDKIAIRQQTTESAHKEVVVLVEQHLSHTPTIDNYYALKEEADKKIKLSASNSIEDLSKLIDLLEDRADLALGIIRTRVLSEGGVSFVGSNLASKSPVIIRDARLQSSLSGKIEVQPNDVKESWMINAAATTRGVLKLIALSDTPSNAALKDAVLGEFQRCMDNLSPINSHTPKERTEFTAHMNHKIKELLKSHKLSVNGQSFASFTDKECSKLLMKARDFTSFESEHPSKITISDNLVNGERINHIESFVPVVPLSTQLKQTYFQDLKNQTWYKDLSPVDQAFTKAYSTKISDDKHIIPTQLQFLPGIHNFGLTSTFFAKDNVVDPNHQYDAMRSASPAYNIGKISKTDKTLMQAITEQNIKHIEDIAYLDKKAVAFRTVTNEIGGEKKMGKAVRATGALDVERTPLSITFSNKDKNLTEIWDKVAESAKKNTRTIVHFGCKSGKDRTGLVDKHNNLSAVKKYLESCGNTDGVKTAAYNVYNKAWHNEHLAGSYGGSLGSHGLKASTSYNLFFNPLSNANLLQQIKRLTATNKVSDLNLPKFMSKEDSNISDYDDKAPLIPFKKTSWLGKIFGKGKGNAR